MYFSLFGSADIHIPNEPTRDDEFQKIFKQVETLLQNNRIQNKVFSIVGDLIDKHDPSPYAIQTAQNLLYMISKYAEIVLVAGNHDQNEHNKGEINGLDAILNHASYRQKVHYFQDSTPRTLPNFPKNFKWILIDRYSKTIPIVKREEGDILIGLYHGSVDTVKYHNTQFTPKDFAQFDIVLLGDIHEVKIVSMKKPVMAYPSSLLQLNFSEKYKHGLWKWTFDETGRGVASYVTLKNPYCFAKIDIVNGKYNLISDEMTLEEFANEGYEYITLRLYLTEKEAIEKHVHIAKIKKILGNAKTVNVTVIEKLFSLASNGKIALTDELTTMNICNIIEKNYREQHKDKSPEILEEKIASIKITFDEIRKLSCKTNAEKVAKTEYSNVELISMRFSNITCFGEDNEINFTNMNGSVVIDADNGEGKTTIIDALLFALYGKSLRSKSLLSRTQKTGWIELILKTNGVAYKIKRTLRESETIDKTGLGYKTVKIYTEVEFYKLSPETNTFETFDIVGEYNTAIEQNPFLKTYVEKTKAEEDKKKIENGEEVEDEEDNKPKKKGKNLTKATAPMTNALICQYFGTYEIALHTFAMMKDRCMDFSDLSEKDRLKIIDKLFGLAEYSGMKSECDTQSNKLVTESNKNITAFNAELATIMKNEKLGIVPQDFAKSETYDNYVDVVKERNDVLTQEYVEFSQRRDNVIARMATYLHEIKHIEELERNGKPKNCIDDIDRITTELNNIEEFDEDDNIDVEGLNKEIVEKREEIATNENLIDEYKKTRDEQIAQKRNCNSYLIQKNISKILEQKREIDQKLEMFITNHDLDVSNDSYDDCVNIQITRNSNIKVLETLNEQHGFVLKCKFNDIECKYCKENKKILLENENCKKITELTKKVNDTANINNKVDKLRLLQQQAKYDKLILDHNVESANKQFNINIDLQIAELNREILLLGQKNKKNTRIITENESKVVTTIQNRMNIQTIANNRERLEYELIECGKNQEKYDDYVKKVAQLPTLNLRYNNANKKKVALEECMENTMGLTNTLKEHIFKLTTSMSIIKENYVKEAKYMDLKEYLNIDVIYDIVFKKIETNLNEYLKGINHEQIQLNKVGDRIGEKLEILILDHKEQRKTDINECSSSEKKLLNIGMRMILSSKNRLLGMSSIIIDEGFDTISEGNKNKITKTLEEIKKVSSSCIVITHDGSIKKMCEKKYAIERKTEGKGKANKICIK